MTLFKMLGIVVGLGLLLLAPVATASREGAGIGAGMALLVFGVLATVALVIAVAGVSGIVIGLRPATLTPPAPDRRSPPPGTVPPRRR